MFRCFFFMFRFLIYLELTFYERKNFTLRFVKAYSICCPVIWNAILSSARIMPCDHTHDTYMLFTYTYVHTIRCCIEAVSLLLCSHHIGLLAVACFIACSTSARATFTVLFETFCGDCYRLYTRSHSKYIQYQVIEKGTESVSVWNQNNNVIFPVTL